MVTADIIAEKVRIFLQNRVDTMKSILAQRGITPDVNILPFTIAPHVFIYPDHIEGVIKVDKNAENEDYWQYVDLGVDGTRQSNGSPFKFRNEKVSVRFEKSIANFMKRKYGEGFGYRKRGEWYGLGVVTKRKGLKPTRFFSDVITANTLKELSDELRMSFKIDVTS